MQEKNCNSLRPGLNIFARWGSLDYCTRFGSTETASASLNTKPTATPKIKRLLGSPGLHHCSAIPPDKS